MGGVNLLGVFAKQPVAGQVKTRLAQDSSPAWAAQVAEAFLLDWLERLQPVEVRRRLVFAPAKARPYFDSISPPGWELQPQEEGHLGQRLHAFFMEALQVAAQVVVLGTDSPTLPLTFLQEAFESLNQADVVLGPATDGGYYLIGCSRWVPELFEGITWSMATVLGETVQQVQKAGCGLHLLLPWYDVDSLEDWHMLRGHLKALHATGVDPHVPRTEKLCKEGF